MNRLIMATRNDAPIVSFSVEAASGVVIACQEAVEAVALPLQHNGGQRDQDDARSGR